jgi:hypothetical protein
MANIPLVIDESDIRTNDTVHLSFAFSVIDKVDSSVSTLPIEQAIPIKALQLSLYGKTSNPNISLSSDGITRLYTLETGYITDKCPHIKTTVIDKAFIIEGYSIDKVNKERILIYLPMKIGTDTTNPFYPLEQSILNKTNMNGFTFNTFIPLTNLGTDYYTMFSHTDRDGIKFINVYFNASSLLYSSALTSKIPVNSGEYKSEYKLTHFKSKTLAKQHNNINSSFEDNIYIDCVPVELENKKVIQYMSFSYNADSIYMDMLLYIVYIITMTIVVYSIYYIYIYSSGSKSGSVTPSASPG